VSEFLLYGHRNLCDEQIATIALALADGGGVSVLMPLYEKMGSLLNEMHHIEEKKRLKTMNRIQRFLH